MKLKQLLLAGSMATALLLPNGAAIAQDNGGGGGGGGGGRRNFDPAQIEQFRQERLQAMRDSMDVKDDAEWKAIQDRMQKVTDARQALAGYSGFGGGRRRDGGGGGGGGGNGGGGGGGGGFRGFGGQPSPELESLRNAISNNAPPEQIKAALEKFRAARKAKQDALTKAQADLKSVLSVKQEAVAVSNGLLE